MTHLATPSMGFSRQEYQSGLPCPSAGVLPDPGIESRSLALQADSFPFEPPGKPDSYKSHIQATLKNTKIMCVKYCRLLEIIYFIL